MQYRPLGRTGLQVSILGLGTGTRFGDARHHAQADATRLVRTALDLGINYIDTAANYHEAESMLGAALEGVPRDQFILATKFFPADENGNPVTAAQLRASVERSLQRLRLDRLDLLQIHGLRPHWLEPVMRTLGDELARLRREERFRFLGVAETIVEDPRHEMVPSAVAWGGFSTALVGYSLLSPWAERAALPACTAAGVGVIGMNAVRRALRDPQTLTQRLAAARARGEAGPAELPEENPLDWLLDAHSLTLSAAGYRFAISHPAIATVLAGTLNIDHLRENVAAVNAPPLPEHQRERVRHVFLRTNPEHWRPYDL